MHWFIFQLKEVTWKIPKYLFVFSPAMSCQVSTGKSGSSWLDRLRTAKGFADHEAPTDLEKFLQNPKSPDTEMRSRKPNSASVRDPPPNEGNQLFDITSNVLNELFNFGDRDSTNLKRSSRKQKNPRICVIGSNRTLENDNATTPLRGQRENELEKFENEARDANLVGFSRTEVTVIDTSYESWKSEKFLFRKKNVWKVRDKKVKSGVLGSKMKRESNGMDGDNRGGKKSIVDKSKGCEFPWIEINVSEVHKMAPNKVGETPKNKQSDLEPKDRTSSVILIKSVHTSTKNEPSIPKSCLHPKQKKT